MALSIRKQPGKTLLVILAGTSLILLLFNQAELRVPFPQPAPSGGYSHRRIQDYSSPEYTASRDDTGDTARESLREQHSASGGKDSEISPPIVQGDATAFEGNDASKVEAAQTESLVNQLYHFARKVVESKPQDVTREDKDSDKVTPPNEPVQAAAAEQDKSNKVSEGNQETNTNNSHGTDTKGAETEENKKPEDSEHSDKEETSDKRIYRPGTKQGLIDSIIEKQRAVLAEAMEGYKFHHKLKAKKMEHLVLETGGQPVRSVVITTWRSGSTFIGDVLQSHPATYYHYEPLLDFDINQVRHGKLAEQALHNIRHLLTCNYTHMEHYLEYGPNHSWLFSHNMRLWHYCTSFPEICWDPDFLSPFCSLFPFQSLKTVRLRLNLTQEFLEDKSLGVQVLLLVRDPRGTMQSRRHRDWCPGNPDCDDPARLCKDLVSDYNTAIQFKKKFPNSFRVVRYEDLSLDAYNMTRELFDFFHLNYHPRVEEFLDTHTKTKIGGVSSTFRNSKTAPVHWKKDLHWGEVEKIQKVCSKALKLWNYEIAKDEEHLRSFNPIGIFKFK